MKDLLPYYERELLHLRQLAREFCARHPAMGSKLQLDQDPCPDPHIELLFQSSALLSARTAKRLDGSHTEFTEPYLEMFLPHFLRPFPSSSIIRASYPSAGVAGARPLIVIPRGTEMDSSEVQGVRCRFKTAYEITLTPARFTAAQFDAPAQPPAGLVLPRSAAATLKIAIEDVPPKLATLRVFIDAEPTLCAALRDALFMHAAGAYVEDITGRWIALKEVPVKQVGFAEDETLLPSDARSHLARRLLSEYFVYPDKFNFFDIDLAPMRARLPPDSSAFTLHLALRGFGPDSLPARQLMTLTEANFLLGCSPVLNLFQRQGKAIARAQRTSEYRLLADATNPGGFEVYSVEEVNMTRQRENQVIVTKCRPMYLHRHGENGSDHGCYWILHHDETLAFIHPGHEKHITLMDRDSNAQMADRASLSIALSCTNRDLPNLLGEGERTGRLTPPKGTDSYHIHLLRKPSRTHRFTAENGLHWRLISHLSLNQQALREDSLAALREMLTLYDLPRSAVTRRQMDGITDLACVEATNWVRNKFGTTLAYGTEIRMTLDEEAFAGSGLRLFVEVIDRYLALYTLVNSFVELVVLSRQTGKELVRCEPRRGYRMLV